MFFLISNLGIYFYRSPAVHCIICFAYKGNKNTVDSRGYLYEYCANDIRFDDYFQADSPASVYFKTLNFKISSSFPRRLSQYKFLRFSDWFLGSRISFRCVSWKIKVLTRWKLRSELLLTIRIQSFLADNVSKDEVFMRGLVRSLRL